ncbi:growth factor receptor-bound protein 14 isoform X1 [Gallus gallus]|uniref:growth factor receptor-bound protein 14 isoform X1 n=2 Tax=Gallus gallus TaxID=9031 RepID=UPI001AE528BD|nr:growth factor receptor-bound protein 14 isoform X1 [Gallus gallus]
MELFCKYSSDYLPNSCKCCLLISVTQLDLSRQKLLRRLFCGGAMEIQTQKRKKTDGKILEIPAIPNPFPELCCSPFASVFSASLLPKATSRTKQQNCLQTCHGQVKSFTCIKQDRDISVSLPKDRRQVFKLFGWWISGCQVLRKADMSLSSRRVTLPAVMPITLQKRVIKVYSEDDSSKTLEIPSDITARDVCQLLILKNHYIDDHNWTLFEELTHTGLERPIEDHELVMEVQSNWGMEEENKFYFRKNYAKYEFFKNPVSFFPDHMISFSSETNATVKHSGILQMFLNSSTYPEVHGYLHAKEQGKKSWKKLYFVLRRSGLYFSTKGTSKEPRHLQFFCEFSNSDIYMSLTGRKISGAPTSYGFCFKPNKSGGTRDLKQLCADDEQSRTCWMTAIRLFKYGMQLYQNYMQPYQGRSGCSPLSVTPMRSISENSLVAMDFSGHRSRIIENPTEALSVAVEEGLAWRRRGCLRLNSHGSPIAMSNMAIHRSQSWFHHKISRDEAQRLILQHGLVDGVFLVRDSQSNPKTFVLSLSHGLKIKHFQIVPLEDDGKLFYTLDDGQTRFTDLIQLVEFYQLNKGVLPCKLKHYCARIPL